MLEFGHDLINEYLRFPAPKDPSTSFASRLIALSLLACGAAIQLWVFGGRPKALPESRIPVSHAEVSYSRRLIVDTISEDPLWVSKPLSSFIFFLPEQ